jgi:hypothetical protein
MGNDVVWVALISAGGALVAAITTQFLAMKAAARQATRTERQEALQWQRSEAKRIREQHEARLRELWAHVLLAQNRIRDALDARSAANSQKNSTPIPSAADSAASAAAQAYSVALIGLPSVRAFAKDFYATTARAEMLILYESELIGDGVAAWRTSLLKLEAAVIDESAAVLS